MGIISGGTFNGGTVTGQTVYTEADINAASVQFKPKTGATVNGTDLIEWYDDAGNLLGYIAADGTVAFAMTGNFANFGFRLNRDAGKWNAQDKNGASVVEVTGDGHLGLFAHATAAQPTLTSGTATPEQIALALQSYGAAGGT